MKFPSLSKFDLLALLSTFLICVLSAGQIINYYFFYDDFFLFYALQFPKDRNSILRATDASGYHFLQPFFSPLFHIFGYEARGYFIISFILFALFIFSFYLFLRIFFPKNKYLALFSSLILASGYVGIEALTWNMGAGPNNTVFLLGSLLSFYFLTLYIKRRRIIYLLGFFVIFVSATYYFQFRSFLLFAWVPILVISIGGLKTKKPLNYFLSLLPIIFIIGLGIFIYTESLRFNPSQGAHVSIGVKQFTEVYIRNIGNIFFPSEFLAYIAKIGSAPVEKAELLAGLLSISFVSMITIFSFLKKMREFSLFLFFSLSTLTSLFLLQLATSLVIITPSVWYSSHRFYIVIFPFVSGFLGTFLIVLQRRYKPIAIFLLGFWIVIHTVLSNQAINTRWTNTISHIRYFYKTLRAHVPKMDADSVLLITQGEPTPVSIFVSARDANAFAGPAGFYGKTVDNFNLFTSPSEAVLALGRLSVSEEKLYALHYKRGELIDVTGPTREFLRSGRKIPLGSNLSGNIINFDQISLPTSAPMYLDMQLVVYPDLSRLGLLKRIDQREVENPEEYFKILFKHNVPSIGTSATSNQKPLNPEHEVSNIIDGDYSTTWIPVGWDKNGVSVTIDLKKERSVNRIVWSSSRTASWYGRLPSDYTIEVSKDGVNFSSVRQVESARILTTGEFSVDEIPEQITRFIKVTIYKTRGGLTPAIDEIEVFSKEDGNINFGEYFTIKQNPERYFPNNQVANRYLEEVLQNSINLEVAWRVDENTDYPSGRGKIILIESGRPQNIHTVLPITIGKDLKSLRIETVNFPAKINIKKAELIYPRLSSFKE